VPKGAPILSDAKFAITSRKWQLDLPGSSAKGFSCVKCGMETIMHLCRCAVSELDNYLSFATINDPVYICINVYRIWSQR